MASVEYQVSDRSRVVVRARSSIHDTVTTWDRVSGTVTADPDALADGGATGAFAVDMTSFHAGDWLKNRKLRKDLDLAAHPRAELALTGLRDVVKADDGTFRAVADGVLRWRGRQVKVAIAGTGRVDGQGVEATGSFDLDIRELGVTPPRFLMFKVESEVTVDVTLVADGRRPASRR